MPMGAGSRALSARPIHNEAVKSITEYLWFETRQREEFVRITCLMGES